MHDFVLVYAKNKSRWSRKLTPRKIEQDNRYKNLDDDPRGRWKSSDLSVKTYNKSTDYSIETPSGRIVSPPSGYCWRVSKEKFEEYVKPSFNLPAEITPGTTSKAIGKSLYEKEGDMNGFEERVINQIANLPNILFWTRNIEKRGFRLNGFINHYPDFIIQTKSGKTIILETKGDHLDNSDSEAKLRLGNAWVQKAGSNFKYFMVFDRKEVNGAHSLDEFILKMREL